MGTIEVIIVGFTIVILTMLSVTLILMLIPYISGERKKENKLVKQKEDPVIIPKEIEITDSIYDYSNQGDIIAVLTAAVMVYAGVDKSLRVTSFRRLGDNSSAWNKAARIVNNS